MTPHESQGDPVGIGQLGRRGGLGPKCLVVLHLPVALGLLVVLRIPLILFSVAVQWHGAFLTEAGASGWSDGPMTVTVAKWRHCVESSQKIVDKWVTDQ